MSRERDPYEVLGVPRNASQAQIREAYRRLARQAHPDLSRNSHSDDMSAINEAYRVLSATPTPLRPSGGERHQSDVSGAAHPTTTIPNRPVAFPWRGIFAASVIGAGAIVALSLFAGPDADSPPDGVIQSGSCVLINDSLLAVEVTCESPEVSVVSQLVPLDARCADGSVGFLDRLGMGRVCLE
jgi:hypothetical protein